MNVDDVKRIAVVGAGMMGHGIAQEFAVAGYEVRIHDLTEERLEKAIDSMRRNLRMQADAGLVSGGQLETTMANIQINTLLEETVAEADVVIEAIYEDLPLKQALFKELDRICPPHTVLSSNTSSFMPSKLASETQRPDKVLVTHFIYPPHLLPLVEVVRSEDTSDETVTTIYDLLTKVGKKPALLQREAPGFIGNRLQAALIREAISIVQQGIATVEDVDIVIRNGFGRRYSVAGTFEIFDIGGLDTALAAFKEIMPSMDSTPEVPRLLQDKVQQGELGMKAGKGFYDWSAESAEAVRQKIAHALLEIEKWSRTS